MRKHVRYPEVRNLAAGAVSVLIGISILCLGIGAAAIQDRQADDLALGVTVAAFVSVGTAALLGVDCICGSAPHFDTIGLMARLFGIVLAVVNLFLLLFGTALGVTGCGCSCTTGLARCSSRALPDPSERGIGISSLQQDASAGLPMLADDPEIGRELHRATHAFAYLLWFVSGALLLLKRGTPTCGFMHGNPSFSPSSRWSGSAPAWGSGCHDGPGLASPSTSSRCRRYWWSGSS